MKRSGLIAIGFVTWAASSCGPATSVLSVNDFNRPTDVAFMCFGAFQQGTATDGGAPDAATGSGEWQVSGRPMQACHPQDEYDPGATTQTRTFAFLPNSAAGTLSAVDADHWKLLDLNLDTGGYGTAPLGSLPEQISVSDDGCQLISANRGSCDLSLVNPSVLVAPTFQKETGGAVLPPSPRAASRTFRPIKGDGTLLTAPPFEAVFLPQDTSSLLPPPPASGAAASLPIQPAQLQMCGDSAAVDPIGWPAQPAPKSWYALVTYPSCDLIAMVALPGGQIVRAAYVRATPDGKSVTLVDAGTSPVCSSAGCAGQALPPSSGASSDAALRSDATATADAVTGTPIEAGASDAAPIASDAGGGAAAGTGGMTGAAGAPGVAGAPGPATGNDAGASGGSPDAGGALLGNQYPPGPYIGPGAIGPSGIAIVPNGSRAYVSLANASFVISVGLTSSGMTLPGNAIDLHEGARGSSRIRLNVDRNRYLTSTNPGVAGVYVGAQTATKTQETVPQPEREYLYAIARDGTVRVIQVANPPFETECETNVDPLFLPPGASAATACIPVDPKHRRPFSIGPGIHFPSLPVDIAAADIEKSPTDTSEQSVNGAHAWVLTDSGIVYLVNLNPVLRSFQWSVSTTNPPYALLPVTETPPFVNTLRDRNEISYSVTLDPSSGPPRVDVLPNVPVTGPYIEPFWTQGSILNATTTSSSYVQTVAFFPQEPTSPTSPNVDDPIDRRAVTPQTWTIAWEGALSGVRNSGTPWASDLGLMNFPGGAAGVLPTDSRFQDGGVNYCALGVVPGDLVTLTGCTDNSQCGLGEQCVFGDGVSTAAAGLTVTGICVDPNREGAQTSLCTDFLNSVRRYEVEAAAPNDLILRPHLDEIVLSSLTPQCHEANSSTGLTDSCPDIANDLTTANFKCTSSYPDSGTGKRCLMPCTLSSDCRAGRLCVDFKTATTVPPFCSRTPDGGTTGNCGCSGPDCFCADAPPFDHTGKACFDQLVNYQVNAGKTFLVAGSQAGFVTTATLPSNGQCAQNPTPDPRFSFRIPMTAPKCSNPPSGLATIDSRLDPFVYPGIADQTSALVSFVALGPSPADPCLYTGGPTAGDPLLSDPTQPSPADAGACADGGTGADGGANGDGGGCTAGPKTTHVRALFQNSQMSFVLANIDRAPTSQFVTSFDVHGGFGAQVVQDPVTVEVSMPARIVLGPVDSLPQLTSGMPPAPAYEAPYLFVVDQHRLGREQGGGPTRGQLLRINPLSYAVTVGSATGYQPIFEDYNASGGLFPIQ